MTNKRKYTKDILEKAAKISLSIAEVARRLGKKKLTGGTLNLISKRLREYNIDVTHFKGQGHNKKKMNLFVRLNHDQIFIERERGSRRNVRLLKRGLIESNVEYICSECEQGPNWNKKPLVLQVDHIDGNFLNDKKENLRFLCPNCHTQTKTFCIAKKKFCVECKMPTRLNYYNGKCYYCVSNKINPETKKREALRHKKSKKTENRTRKLKFEIKTERLSQLIEEMPITKIAKIFGVTGNAIKKRCQKFGIKVKPSGFWARKNRGFEINKNELIELLKTKSTSEIAKKYGVRKRQIDNEAKFYKLL